MTNVSAAAGRLRSDESRAWMPTRSSTSRDARNGDGAPSIWMPNVASSGAG